MIIDVEKLHSGSILDVSFSRTFVIPEEYALSDNVVDVRVVGTVSAQIGRYVFEGAADASFCSECARCLEPVIANIMFKFQSVFTYTPDTETYDDVYPVVGGRADLSEAVLSNLLIEIPVKFLCDKDCKGICPFCGVNRNIVDCDCV